jgi:hypothetical protein
VGSGCVPVIGSVSRHKKSRTPLLEYPMSQHIDFFFNFGSTYSYLSIMRLEEQAAKAGVEVRWRPFNVRKLFVEQTNIPFPKEKAAKVTYMWRDIERRAAHFGLEWNGIPPYPVDRSGLANRLGVIAGREGWAPAFTRSRSLRVQIATMAKQTLTRKRIWRDHSASSVYPRLPSVPKSSGVMTGWRMHSHGHSA